MSPRRRLLAAFLTLVIAIALMSAGSAAASEVILPGIQVGGIDVGNLTAAEASNRLAPAARVVEARQIKLVVGKRTWTRTPEDLGISVDIEETVAAALDAGRGNPFKWVIHTIGGAEKAVKWVPRIDKADLTAELNELSRQVKIEATNGSIELSGAEVVAKPPTEGIQLLVGATRKELVDRSLMAVNSRIALPVTVTPPDIDAEDVRKIEEQARAILAGPVVFILNSQEIIVPADKIAQALKVHVEDAKEKGQQDSLLLQVDAVLLKDQIASVAPQTVQPSKDASFSVSDGKVSIQPSQDGVTLDTAAASSSLLALKASERLPIPLSSRSEPAQFTTEHARELKIVERISSFTTTFDPQNAPRVANIDLMADAIDDTVLKPGESFSMNDTTGPRTPANGYQEAQIIVDGELVPGIGGGVCQVATTVFNAVFQAGLDVLQRSNHSLHISKYPLGRDAMVNYPSQDLRFKNDSDFGVLLKAAVTSKAMIVSIYSSQNGRNVEATTSDRTNPRPPPTKYVDDPNLPQGQEQVQEEGSAGFDITVTRRVVGPDGKELHNEKFVSKYKPWKRIIRRGTGPPASPSPS